MSNYIWLLPLNLISWRSTHVVTSSLLDDPNSVPLCVHTTTTVWNTLGYFSPNGHFEQSYWEICTCVDTLTQRLTAAICTIATLWDHPKESTAEGWVRKMWYARKAESGSATENETLWLSAGWTLLEIAVLVKLNRSQKDRYRYIRWRRSRNRTVFEG